jgi:eukaryotic-like serine/threonine-protein kinase
MTAGDTALVGALLRAFEAPEAKVLPTRPLAGRFQLQRRLGEGGFGVVYAATDLRSAGEIALKVLRNPDGGWLYRFKREFRTLQGLSHRSLVSLGELFCEDGLWFFTMELIAGINFVDYVRGASKTNFNEHRLRQGLRQLFEALSVIHAAGKIHRDIKPSNVLVTSTGRVVLIDFGLAADVNRDSLSEIAGTPFYMAPEQATAQVVGAPADLYSVGVMLYECLTGRRPVEGTPIQVLIDKQTLRPPSPASIASNIPEDLSSLCMQLIDCRPVARPSAGDAGRSVLAMIPANVVRTDSCVSNGTFVGRGAELDALFRAFDDSQRGHLAGVLVTGESGVGKTRLVRCFADKVLSERPKTFLLEGRCHERETIPYKALDGIIDALTRRLSRMAESDIAALLPTRRSMLVRIFPAFLRVPQLAKEHARRDERLGPEDELRERAFHELRELFTRLAAQFPTVIVVDDLQWADDDGLRALTEIVRSTDAPPLLLVGTVRDTAHDAGTTRERFRRVLGRDLQIVELTNLNPLEARALAEALLGRTEDDPDATRIAQEAGGHPLFLEELTHYASLGEATRADIKLEDVLRARVQALAPAARELVELLATAGTPLAYEIAASATRLGANEFQRSIVELRVANLVRTSATRWSGAIEPYHDRVREILLAQIEPDRRRTLHETLATAFEAMSHPDPEALAVHWREAGSNRRAATYALAAGDQAARTFAFDRAAAWFQQALELMPESGERRDLRVKLGDALAFAGRGVLAAPHLEAAAMESPPLVALDLRRRAAEQLMRSGYFDRGLDASRAVLAAIGMRLPTSRWETIIWLGYYAVRLRFRGFRFRERDERDIGRSQLMTIDTCWSITAGLSFTMSFVSAIFLHRTLLLALSAGEPSRIMRAMALYATLAAIGGGRSMRRAELLARRAQELADRLGGDQERVVAGGMSGAGLYLSGRFREAAKRLESNLQTLDHLEDAAAGIAYERTTFRFFYIQALAMLGRFRELHRLQQTWLAEGVARGDLYAVVNLRIGFANLVWLIDDRPDVANDEVRAAMSQWSSRGFHNEHFYALMAQVWTSLYSSDFDQAYILARELVTLTKSVLLWRTQTMRVRVRFVYGATALAHAINGGRPRQKLLEEAADAAHGIKQERMAWSDPLARALEAGIFLQAGEEQSAVRALDRAASEFSEQGMTAYAAAARDRSARIRGSLAAAEQIRLSAEFLRAEGVVAPERMISLLLPGLTR